MRSANTDFGILLGLAYQDFVAELNAHLERRGFDGIGASFGYVFRALLVESLTTSQLADRLHVTAQGASKLVDLMVDRGYVERQPDPVDRRAKRLQLSEKGRRAVAEARRFHAEYERRLAEVHGAETIAALRVALTAMEQRAVRGREAPNRMLHPL